MKHIISILFILVVIILPVSSQSKKQIAEFKEFEAANSFSTDGDNIVVSRILEGIKGSKDDIYIKAKSFFAHNYNDSKSVIQTEDKEAGVIIGKGYFGNLKKWTDIFGSQNAFGAYHILRLDIKDGRIRAICSSSEWEYSEYGSKYSSNETKRGLIKAHYPFAEKKFVDKGKQIEAVINLVNSMNAAIDLLEKSLTEGNIKAENEDW